jgi:hypothetical protein
VGPTIRRAAGDIAAIVGISKALIEADDEAVAQGGARVVDVAFITEHTHAHFAADRTGRNSNLSPG